MNSPLTPGDEIEVKLQPYPGAEDLWVLARVETKPEKNGEFLVLFLNGFTYHGGNRKMVMEGDWRTRPR